MSPRTTCQFIFWRKATHSWRTNITNLEGLPESNFWISSRDELLPKISFIAGRRNSLYNWLVLQFLRLVELMATRIARRVIVSKIVMILANSAYDIALHDLHMVNIVEQSHRW